MISTLFYRAEAYEEFALQLVDIIFSTLFIYDDRGSREAVDNVIIKALSEITFMKSFAAALVQSMEKQSKFHTRVGCYRLLKWSCLLVYSQFSTISKNAFSRLGSAQATLIHILMEGSFRERRACKQTFFHLLSQVYSVPFSINNEMLHVISSILIIFANLFYCAVGRHLQNVH